MTTTSSNVFGATIQSQPFPDPTFIIPTSFGNGTAWSGKVLQDLADGAAAQLPPSLVTNNQAIPNDLATAGQDVIIQLAAGTHPRRYILDIEGTSANPITIRSDPAGKVTIRRPDSGTRNFVWQIKSSNNFVIDGSTTTNETYGFFITSTFGDNTTSGIQLTGYCQDLTIKNVEVDGNWTTYGISEASARADPPIWGGGINIGIQLNDNNALESVQAWRENIVVESCYTHDLFGEGIYLGPNYNVGSTNEIPLRNCSVRYSVMINCGRDGAQIKSSLQGTNDFHHNYVKSTGLWEEEYQGGQKLGLGFFEGCGNTYNNWIEDAGEHAISFTSLYRPSSDPPYALPDFNIYNNIVINSGAASDSFAQAGMGVHCDHSGSGRAQPDDIRVYNNTIVNTEAYGMRIYSVISSDVTAQNNIVYISGISDIGISSSGTNVVNNNWLTSNGNPNFGTNYSLTASTPSGIRNGATTGLRASTDNYGMWLWVQAGADPYDPIEPYATLDRVRPVGSQYCKGALEYTE